MRPLYAIVLLFGLTACSHDASRKNPLDPELTPAVTVQAAIDSTTGVVSLAWTPYVGSTDFAGYRVLRNVLNRVDADTLATVVERETTSFSDSTLDAEVAYEYRIEVLNADGFESASNRVRIDGFTLRAARVVSATADPGAGAVRLTWTRYVDPLFEGYEVRRSLVGSTVDTTLAVRVAATDTTFVDTFAIHTVSYLYHVVVLAAGRELEGASVVGTVDLPAATGLSAVLDATTASATLAWTPYDGPRFAHYEVQRRAAGDAYRTVERIDDQRIASWRDVADLRGDTVYAYRVVTHTVRGEQVVSGESSGRFHERVDSWSLDIDDDAFVRLYTEEAGQLSALVSTEERIRLLHFSTGGNLLDDIILFENPEAGFAQPPRIVPGGVATVLQDGSRRLVVPQSTRIVVLDQTLDGQTIYSDTLLFSIPLREGASVDPGVNIEGANSTAGGSGAGLVWDNVAVWAGGRRILQETFSIVADDLPSEVTGDWEVSQRSGTRVVSQYVAWGPGVLSYRGAGGQLRYPDLRAEAVAADMWLSERGAGTLRLGGLNQVGGAVGLTLDQGSQSAYVSSGLLAEGPSYRRAPISLPPWLRYHANLRVVDGWISATLSQPRLVSHVDDVVGGMGAAAVVDGLLAFVSGDSRYTVDAVDGEVRPEPTTATADLRVWNVDGDSRMALCLADENRVLVGRPSVSSFSGVLTWPVETAQTSLVLGEGAGQDDGEMVFPLSIDRGQDGRFYVLDAGNARIQVFDADGSYLTQWGTGGSASGQFDFGVGNVSTDFAGSIAVDDEGFIYVADVGNRRIQKFAP